MPTCTASIVPPSFNLSKSEEQIKTQSVSIRRHNHVEQDILTDRESQQETDEEIARSKENHTAKMNGIKQRIDQFWKDMQELKSASELSVSIKINGLKIMIEVLTQLLLGCFTESTKR